MKLLPSVHATILEIPTIDISSNSHSTSNKYVAELIYLPVIHNTNDKDKKGTNELTDEEIQSCYVFEERKVDLKIDITIIACRSDTGTDSLLLLRFHRCKDYSQSFALPFYQHAFKNIIPGKSGYETRRTGGSSGITTNPIDDNLINFLNHHKTSTPRRVRAVKIIQTTTKYNIHYISPYSSDGRKAVFFSYSPPRRGGSFYVTPDVFLKFPFLMHFAECKIKAAFILEHLFSSGVGTIAEQSFKQELKHYYTTFAIASTIKNDATAKCLAVLLVYNSFNMHSIVCYNVGYHVDKFHKGMASLENKAVFRITSLAKACEIKDERGRGGGAFVGDYHYALLDWGRTPRARRNIVVEIGIIGPNQHLMQAVLLDYFNNHPDQQQAFEAAVNAALNATAEQLSETD